MYRIMFVWSRQYLPFSDGGICVCGPRGEGGQALGIFRRFFGRFLRRDMGDIGNPVYPPVKALLAEKGISCGGKRAVQLKASDGEKYDLFACMDEGNLRGAKRILGAKNGEKCKKLLSFAGSDEDVSDPWYTRDFVAAYEDILRGCKGILDSVK